jgi:hypothetical protein
MLKESEVSNEGRILRLDCRLFIYVSINEGKIIMTLAAGFSDFQVRQTRCMDK